MPNWTTKDIPNLNGQVAVVTGANGGLGLETAAELAAKGAHVVIAVRNVERGRDAAQKIRDRTPQASLHVQELDLGSLASVRSAGQALRTQYDRIDLLVNNAGVSQQNARTVDGLEIHLGTNHVGPFLLTCLLLDRILESRTPRIVSVSSTTHRLRAPVNFDDPNWEVKNGPWSAYGRSKLANLLFTYELDHRLRGTSAIAVAAHPGGSATGLMRNASWVVRTAAEALLQSPAMGALSTLRAATDKSVLGGQYFGPSGLLEIRGHPKPVTSSDLSYDVSLRKQLWDMSEQISGTSLGLPT